MTQRPTRDDITAAVYQVHKIALRLHLKAEPDARSVSFLVGLAEVILRARASGAILGHAATKGARRANQTVLGRGCLASAEAHPEAYGAGLMAGAAAAGTLRADRGGWLLGMAQGVAAAHGMTLAEAIAILAVGSGGSPQDTRST